MDIGSIVIIALFGASLLLGFILGFGKTLKFITSGVVGVIFSIIICVMFGGIIANIPFVADLITKGNVYFGTLAQVLAKINLATIIYYIVLFILVQIVRIIIVKIIAKVFEPSDKEQKGYGARMAINRVLGMLLFGAFCVFLVYLALAIMKVLEDVGEVQNILNAASQKKSLFYAMYEHNPVNLDALFTHLPWNIPKA